MAISGFLHLAAFALIWWGATREGLGRADIQGAPGNAGVALEVFAADEFRQRVELVVMPALLDKDVAAEQSSEDATDEPLKSLEQSVDRADGVEPLEIEQPVSRKAAMELNELSRATSSALAAPSTAGNMGAEDGLRAAYLKALQTAIRGQWKEGSQGSASCRLTLLQSPGGSVISAASHDCQFDDDVRKSLEAAALLAQPLPYSGFETVYSDEVTMVF